MIEMCDPTMRQQMANYIQNSADCQRILDELRKLECFLDDFGSSNIGINYSYFTAGEEFLIFSPNRIAFSVTLTMGSIISCCESGCIADANILLRKYRDDLFFLLYVSLYHSLDENSKKAKEIKSNINKWQNNSLWGLKIGQILSDIANAPQLREAIVKYNLKESFIEMGKRLDNYVHGNGRSFYNRNYVIEGKGVFPNLLSKIVVDTKYFTVVFLFLLFLIDSPLVASDDYVDFLDCGEVPPEGCQYWVAPFIDQFIVENASLIDANCLEYLKKNTSMKLP